MRTKSEIVRAWFAGKKPPVGTADCAQCAAETGIAASTVFYVMRHAPTPEARRAYYRESKRIYLQDPENRAAHNEYMKRYNARKRAANKTNEPASRGAAAGSVRHMDR